MVKSDMRDPPYRQHHSTEIALVRVYNDLLKTIDINGAAILFHLYLSAAFSNTINHAIHPHELQQRYQITGPVLSWISSYLVDRHQCIFINGIHSKRIRLKYGVHQRSISPGDIYKIDC